MDFAPNGAPSQCHRAPARCTSLTSAARYAPRVRLALLVSWSLRASFAMASFAMASCTRDDHATSAPFIADPTAQPTPIGADGGGSLAKLPELRVLFIGNS